MAKPPTMTRSRGQLASSYAPEAFFTFEGGIGACIATPSRDSKYDRADLTVTTERQILQRVDDVARSWFQRAMTCRDAIQDGNAVIRGELCVDAELLNPSSRSETRPLRESRVLFINALHMSYEPAPLSFVCTHCKYLRTAASASVLSRSRDSYEATMCPHPKRYRKCSWQQLDVVHVHWSGGHEAPMAARYDWDSDKQEIYRRDYRCCGHSDFVLDNQALQLSKWRLRCAHCAQPVDIDGWRQADRFTIGVLGPTYPQRVRDAAMALTSYRASDAYYPQSEQFILFDKGHEDVLRLLDAERRRELEAWLGRHFGYADADVGDEWLRQQLRAHPDQQWLERFERKLRQLARATGREDSADLADAKQDLAEFRNLLLDSERPVVSVPISLPAAVGTLIHIADRNPRFDPVRLALEHNVLREQTLDAPADNYGRRRFVPFDALDYDMRPTGDVSELKRIQTETRRLASRMAFARLGLIREFELCRFTFGFTRTSPQPVKEWLNAMMPVRLNLFPTISDRNEDQRHPIYVQTQSNEAIYVQLNAATVLTWLRQCGADEGIPWEEGDRQPFGAHVLERAKVLPRFLDAMPSGPPSAYLYVYTLLHTLAHGFMKEISVLSGLELGSMSEYVFPTDLAFVVYRSGTTMDLGNLSSLWRNENIHFLRGLLDPMAWRCNSGSLCSEKGGACPDCILVPETSCIAQNRLLCRSVISGGRAPLEDERGAAIAGLFS